MCLLDPPAQTLQRSATTSAKRNRQANGWGRTIARSPKHEGAGEWLRIVALPDESFPPTCGNRTGLRPMYCLPVGQSVFTGATKSRGGGLGGGCWCGGGGRATVARRDRQERRAAQASQMYCLSPEPNGTGTVRQSVFGSTHVSCLVAKVPKCEVRITR